MDVQPHLLNLSAYINQNLEKDLPLSSLAKRVGLSPFHFHRKFGAYFGESLHQHIKRLRLERAAFALVHGTAPVRQIARESGYKTVSAFSHAFSGFAGESPTKYRTLAANDSTVDGEVSEERLEPAWIGELPPQEIAFLRATGSGRNVQGSVRQALDLIVKLIGPLKVAASQSATDQAEQADEDGADFECIAATSDIYRIVKGRDFRIDIGLDAGRVPDDRGNALGRQTLPGGRYARFDIRCKPDDVMDHCLRVSLSGLRSRGETPRLSQYFVKFTITGRDAETPVDFAAFVPLIG